VEWEALSLRRSASRAATTRTLEPAAELSYLGTYASGSGAAGFEVSYNGYVVKGTFA